MRNKIVIASDHAGFELKSSLILELTNGGYIVEDVGCNSAESVDYPDYAYQLTDLINSDNNLLGILICATGIGMSVAANKVKGIRAALVTDKYMATMAKLHNDANILVIPAKIVDANLAIEMVLAWATTEFEGGRHERRINKIRSFEEGKSS
ncbi:MAG: ribose 5-phosphate isomerase B [Nitrospinota bacterium]